MFAWRSRAGCGQDLLGDRAHALSGNEEQRIAGESITLSSVASMSTTSHARSTSHEKETIRSLGDRVYAVPGEDTWQTADEYLSGPVRVKLATAIAAADADPVYQRNVDASSRGPTCRARSGLPP